MNKTLQIDFIYTSIQKLILVWASNPKLSTIKMEKKSLYFFSVDIAR